MVYQLVLVETTSFEFGFKEAVHTGKRVGDPARQRRDSMRTVSTYVMQALFDRGGLKAGFEHIRNLVIATILIAAGFEAVKRFDTIDLPGLSDPVIAGYVVAGTGCILVALNFLDALRKLSRLRWHYALQAVLGIGYLFFSVRIVQLIIYFKSHSC